MANISRAEREARKAAAVNLRQPKPGLVPMEKGGYELEIHPSCVKAHQLKGWQLKEHHESHN